MTRIPVRTLNQDTAGVLARVERGETVEITRRGRVIAVMSPVGTAGELDDWITDGRVVPATEGGPFTTPSGPAATGTEAGGLIRALRDEESW